jgi:hypothetical protein
VASDARRYQARVWDRGVATVVGTGSTSRPGGVCWDVVTPEGHTVQLLISERNEVIVRGWLVGDQYENGGDNNTVFSVHAFLPDRESITQPNGSSGAGS